ncbi:O-antigen ligase family protein [Natrinema pallidum]|nr:O-antigen ligase family protein [Natrinema pallidum]
MRLNALKNIKTFDTDLSAERDAYTLGLVLIVGLMVLTPILSLITPISSLVWVAIICLVYGIAAIAIGRITIGVYVSLLVSLMFAADIPLASSEYLLSMTRDIGPSIWFAHIPLFGFLGMLYFQDKKQFLHITKEEIFLGAFIIWTIFAAAITDPVRLDAPIYFALFILWGGLIFAAVRRAHRILPISGRTTMSIIFTAVLANALFALTEILHGDSYGLTTLGELSPEYTDQIAGIIVGPITLPVGTFVSGFSGMSFILASIIILVAPFSLSLLFEHSPYIKLAGVLSTLILVVVLRFTASDAARGGLLLAIGIIFAYIIVMWLRDNRTIDHRTLVIILTMAILCTGIVLFPSTMSGTPGEQSIQQGPETPEEQHTQKDTTESNSPVDESEVSVPLFDLSNLGPRLQQYTIGVSLFTEQPIFGIGGGNFAEISQEYNLHEQKPIHNVYISLLAETGIIGFILYTGFLVTVLRRGVQGMTAAADTIPLQLVILAGVIGYLGFMFWDHLLFNSIVGSFTFYAVCATLVSRKQDNNNLRLSRESRTGSQSP